MMVGTSQRSPSVNDTVQWNIQIKYNTVYHYLFKIFFLSFINSGYHFSARSLVYFEES